MHFSNHAATSQLSQLKHMLSTTTNGDKSLIGYLFLITYFTGRVKQETFIIRSMLTLK